MAESGRFMTKCVIRFRRGLVSAGVTFEIGWPSAASFWRRLRSFSSCCLLDLGPEQAGNGSSNTRDTIVRIKSRPSSHVTRTKSLTLRALWVYDQMEEIRILTRLSCAFFNKYLALFGFKSLASTAHPFLAAGTAKGPTPANTSATTSSDSNCWTSRSCSVCNREFQ